MSLFPSEAEQREKIETDTLTDAEILTEKLIDEATDTLFSDTAATATETAKEDEQLSDTASSPLLTTDENESAPATAAAPINYRIKDSNIGAGTPKERYANNVAAIRLLKEADFCRQC